MALERSVAAGAAHRLVKIDLVAVKVRAVYAGKLRFAANGQAAAAAHARAVYHDRIHGNNGLLVVFLCGEADELHHDQRADGDDLVKTLAVFKQRLQRGGDIALFAVGAVVRHQREVVGASLEFVFQNHEILIPRPWRAALRQWAVRWRSLRRRR